MLAAPIPQFPAPLKMEQGNSSYGRGGCDLDLCCGCCDLDLSCCCC